jgi:hypothetical protein
MKVVNIVMLVWCVVGLVISTTVTISNSVWQNWMALVVYGFLTVWWIHVIRTEMVKK